MLVKGAPEIAALQHVAWISGSAKTFPNTTMDQAPWMSVVIPVLNEASTLPLLLADLRSLPFPIQMIVADGGSTDESRAIAVECGAEVVCSARGRGRQLRAGAEHAAAPMVGFVHADARLHADARKQLETMNQHPLPDDVAWVFTLKIESPRWPYRIVEAGASLRTRLFGLPYGDQGLFMSRALYKKTGGFAEVPLMEDVEMMRSLRGLARTEMCVATIAVSARRWERDGVCRRSLHNMGLLLRWYLGASPERLAIAYDHSRRAGQ